MLLNLNLVYGDLWANVYAHHNNRAWCKATDTRYASVRTGRKKGTRGAARVDDQLVDKCFSLLLELLLFGWIGTAELKISKY